MNFFQRTDLRMEKLPGRTIQRAVGVESRSISENITMGFARYSDESGQMTPHQHAEEIVYILSAKDGWIRFGDDPKFLGEPIPLWPGMVLHVPAFEWHVFEHTPDGYVDIIFFYGQVDQIRPEEME